ncbi:MAG: hypothetical protein K2K85_01215 [Clostridia bacterium]|nr:hypothetical protein [Clostridia bacterium]
MSDQIRTLQGRIDIVFGKEDQDNGVSIFPSNNENEKEIDYDLKKALISLNDMSLDEPIFHLNSTQLHRGARLIGKKQLYIKTLGDDGVTLRYSFARSRGIAHWTIAGIKYDYKKYNIKIVCSNVPCDKEEHCLIAKREAAGAFAIEIPCEVEYTLYNSEQKPVKTIDFSLITKNLSSVDEDGNSIDVDVAKGLYFKRTEYISTGDNQEHYIKEAVLKKPFLSHELRFELGTGYNEKFSGISVTIKRAHRIFVSGGEYIYYTKYVENELGLCEDDFFNAEDLTQCWISKCYDNQTEIYDGNEIQDMEITRQLPNSEGDVNYGLVSNSFRAKILNENRKLDLGYLKDIPIMGKRVLPQIIVDGKEHRLGTYFISEWDIPMDNSWVEFQAVDRLTDLQSLMYNGFFPEKDESNNLKSESLYRIIETVIESINDNLLIQLENKLLTQTEAMEKLLKVKGSISEELYEKVKAHIDNDGTLIEGVDLEYFDMEIKSPYLERQSIWDVLDNIAKSTLSVIYIDEQDRLIFHSDMNDKRHFLLDGEFYQYNICGCYSKIGANSVSEASATQVISSSNAFSLSKPKKRKAVVTEVSTSYYTYNFEDSVSNQEDEKVITYYIKDLQSYEIDENGFKHFKICVPKFMFDKSIVLNGINRSCVSSLINENNCEYYDLTIEKDYNFTSESCEIIGKPISNSSTSITVRDFSLEDQNALDYTAGTLLNDVESANKLANRLIELYGKGRELFESEWLGDLGYDINLPMQYSFILPIGASDGKEQNGTNCVVSNNISFDGSLRQTLKALSYFRN